MATVRGKASPVSGNGSSAGWKICFTGMKANDVAEPVSYADYPSVTIQVAAGEFGGASVQLLGTLDESNWEILSSMPQGFPIDIETPRIMAVLEPSVLVQPRVLGGDDTTSLDVTLFFRRVNS